MDSESIYTDNEIAKVADKVAEFLFSAKPILREMIIISKQYRDGPLTTFLFWSNKYNPLGEFRIEVETLTMAQKKIVVRIVGNAMVKLNPDR